MAKRRKKKLQPRQQKKGSQPKGQVDVGLGTLEAEVTLFEEGDTTVKAVAGIDLAPATLDIDYDSTTGELAVAGEVGLPGDLVGVTGGITVDTDTGEITAITGGVAVAGLEIVYEQGIGSRSCRSIGTITFFGVGISYVVDTCEDEDGGGSDDEEGADPDEDYPPPPGDRIPPGWQPGGHLCRIVRVYYKAYFSRSDGGGYLGLKILRISIGGYAPPDYGYGYADSSWYDFIFDSKDWRTVPAKPENGIVEAIQIGWSPKRYEIQPDISGPRSYLANRVIELPYSAVSSEVCFYDIIDNIDALLDRARLLAGEYKDAGAPRYITHSTNPAWNQKWGCIWGSPPPPPLPKPKPPPLPPYRNRRNSMSDNCCQANLRLNRDIREMMRQMLNVVGGREETAYPIPVETTNGNGATEVKMPANLIEWLYLQPKATDLTKVIGVSSDSLWPKTVTLQSSPTARSTEVTVNNITELLELMGGSTGYAKDVWPKTLKLNSGRKFKYNSNGEALVNLLQVLAPHKLLQANDNKGYEVPKEMLVPGAVGFDYTKDYAGVLTRIGSMINRYGFDSPLWIHIKDANPAIEGDQPVGFEVNSLAGAIEKLLYSSIDNASDIDAQTNILVRLSYLLTRTYMQGAQVWHRLEAILDGLGIGIRQKREEIPCEFDPFANKKFKGFKDRGNPQLDFNEEETTEKLLPSLLKNSQLQVKVEEFKKKTGSICDKLIELVNKNDK